MHIKEVTLEGFKSYAGRTVVSGFDPLFNAITGLNGSGKSNILDSICFVLGITDLRQVRAASLQELVYKQGQAGVTKATVSIVFDNSDRSRSPLGYEDSPEITVTRQVTHPFAIFVIPCGLLKRILASARLSSLGDFLGDFGACRTILICIFSNSALMSHTLLRCCPLKRSG
jgi:hypothetical protein